MKNHFPQSRQYRRRRLESAGKAAVNYAKNALILALGAAGGYAWLAIWHALRP